MNNKGQNAVVRYNNQICLVNKGGKKGELIFWSEKHKALRVYKNVNLDSPQIQIVDIKLAPSELQEQYAKATMTVSNGQFVSFMNGNDKVYGTVIRGGRNPKIIDVNITFEYQVPAYELTIEEKPNHQAPDALSMYGVKKFKEHKELSEETIAFSADLHLQVDPKKRSKVIAHVSNNGCGGCMDFQVVDGDAYREFCETVKQTCKERGLSEFEVDEQFILWLGLYKQLNVSFDDHIGKPLNVESALKESNKS